MTKWRRDRQTGVNKHYLDGNYKVTTDDYDNLVMVRQVVSKALPIYLSSEQRPTTNTGPYFGKNMYSSE